MHLLNDAQLLARLVGFDTTSRNSNLALAEFICDYLDQPGIRIVRNPSPDGEKTNLVATVGPEVDPDRRDGLILSGHMDVVPADPTQWDSDPFRVVERGEAYIGRGTCDMKGFLALAINRAAQLGKAALRAPLVLLLTYDEEVGTVGAKHFVQTWPNRAQLPRCAIIGEPTSLQPVRIHKGHLKFRLGFRGTSAHSGYPHLGVNAIEPAAKAIGALAALRDQWHQERPEGGRPFAEVPHLTLNVAQVRGGTAVNVVPDACRVDLGVRTLPRIQVAEIQTRLAQVLEEALEGHPVDLELTGESPALETPQEADLYQALCQEVGRPTSESVSYATDAGWLQHAGLECVVFGPGSITVAHKPNESLPMRDFIAASGMLDTLVRRFCRVVH